MIAVPTDFHTDDPGQLRADLEKLARAVKAIALATERRVPRWSPTPVRFTASDVEFDTGARFAAAVAATLPLGTPDDEGRSLAVRVTAAVTVTLTPRGGQLIDGAATMALVGPGLWIVWWDGEGFSACP